ncbi:MAG: hypothetical protein ACTSVD_01925 [Candidatus Thorarchaeota archaeon]|nr:MAG: hypothetical protein DRO93_10650 [Candidatus Thorarchaeota archaeon]
MGWLDDVEEYIRDLGAGKVTYEEVEQALFNKYCMKSNKTECEPAYCIFRIVDSCPYCKALRTIPRELR